jgi:hypothetical protein
MIPNDHIEEQKTVSFSAEEILQIKNITISYTEMYKEAVKIQDEITQSEEQLRKLITNIDKLKETEYALFKDLAAKKDLEPQTIANAAANYILNEKR